MDNQFNLSISAAERVAALVRVAAANAPSAEGALWLNALNALDAPAQGDVILIVEDEAVF